MVGDVRSALESHVAALGQVTPAGIGERPADAPPDLDEGTMIGLGEGTHGTREFVTLRHRLLQYLVEKCGFRTVGLEAPFVPTIRVDAAVRDEGDAPAVALSALDLWVWQTKGLAALFRWLRRFNEGRPMDDRVRVVGIGLTDPSRPAERLASILPELDVTDACLREELTAFATTDHARTQGVEALEEGVTLGGAARERLLSTVGEPETRAERLGHRLCRQLEQSCDWNQLRLLSPGRFDPEAYERRDAHMAETAVWALETDPGDGAVVWGHNAHVQRGEFDMPQDWASGTTMGEAIHQEIGAAYRPLGTSFYQGQFRATVPGMSRPERQEAGPPIERSVEATLGDPNSDALFLDLASIGAEGLEGWTETTRPVRAIPALMADGDTRSDRYQETDLTASFDGIFHISRSTPTRLLGTVEF